MTLDDLINRLKTNLQRGASVARKPYEKVYGASAPQQIQRMPRQAQKIRTGVQRLEQSPYGQFARKTQKQALWPLKTVSQLRRLPDLTPPTTPPKSLRDVGTRIAQSPFIFPTQLLRSYGQSAHTLSEPERFKKAPLSEKAFAVADIADFLPMMAIAGKVADVAKIKGLKKLPKVKIKGTGETGQVGRRASKILSEAGQRTRQQGAIEEGVQAVSRHPSGSIIPQKAKITIKGLTKENFEKNLDEFIKKAGSQEDFIRRIQAIEKQIEKAPSPSLKQARVWANKQIQNIVGKTGTYKGDYALFQKLKGDPAIGDSLGVLEDLVFKIDEKVGKPITKKAGIAIGKVMDISSLKGEFFLPSSRYTVSGTQNKEWVRTNIPLLRMGNKRGMIGYILNVLGIKQRDIGSLALKDVAHLDNVKNVEDLFGGSGLLANLSKKIFPKAKITYNELDPTVINSVKQSIDSPDEVLNYVRAIKNYYLKNPNTDWLSDFLYTHPELKSDKNFLTAANLIDKVAGRIKGEISVDKFRALEEAIPNFSKTFKNITITAEDALKKLDYYAKNGTPKDFLWIDPPYLWSSGYGVGSEMEKVAGFKNLLSKLEQLNEKGVKFIFFNNEPSSKVAKAGQEAVHLSELESLIARLSHKGMEVVRNISPVSAQNRREIVVSNLGIGEERGTLRGVEAVKKEIASVLGGVGREAPQVFHAEPTLRTLGKVAQRSERAVKKTQDVIYGEWQKAIRAETLSQSQRINQATDMVKQSTDDAIRAKLSEKADKVFMIDFRTPENVFKKLGIHDEVYVPLRQGQEEMSKELQLGIGKLNNWYRRTGKGSSQRIFDYLDGVKADLNKDELKVANEIKIYLTGWADKLGLPKEKRIANYITHIFEPDFAQGKRIFPPELARILDFTTPNKVFNPFLETRTGAKGYKRDVFEALDVYMRRGARKLHLDKPIESMAKYADFEGPQAQRYLDSYLKNLAGRPDKFEKWVDDNVISALPDTVRQKLGNRPFSRIVNLIRGQVYRGALGLNVGSSVKNLSQNLNTFAELGPKRVAGGLFDLLRNGTDELVQNQVLEDIIYAEHRELTSRGMIKKMDDVLFFFFDTAERINRGIAYYGAKADGLTKGMNEAQAIDYAKGIVRKTQFAYGKIDMPLALQSSWGKLGLQFGSYPIKQAELLGGYAKNKEVMKLARYIAGTFALTAMGAEAVGIDIKELYNIFPSLGPIPDIAMDVKGALTGDWKAKSNLAKSPFLFIPGGVQARKTLQSLQTIKEGASRTPTGKFRFEAPKSALGKAQALTLGQWVTPEAQDYLVKKGLKKPGLFSVARTKEEPKIRIALPSATEDLGTLYKDASKTVEGYRDKKTKIMYGEYESETERQDDLQELQDKVDTAIRLKKRIETEKPDQVFEIEIDTYKSGGGMNVEQRGDWAVEQLEKTDEKDRQELINKLWETKVLTSTSNGTAAYIKEKYGIDVGKYTGTKKGFGTKAKKAKKGKAVTIKKTTYKVPKLSFKPAAMPALVKLKKPPALKIKTLREKKIKVPAPRKAKVTFKKPEPIRVKIAS